MGYSNAQQQMKNTKHQPLEDLRSRSTGYDSPIAGVHYAVVSIFKINFCLSADAALIDNSENRAVVTLLCISLHFNVIAFFQCRHGLLTKPSFKLSCKQNLLWWGVASHTTMSHNFQLTLIPSSRWSHKEKASNICVQAPAPPPCAGVCPWCVGVCLHKTFYDGAVWKIVLPALEFFFETWLSVLRFIL